MVVDKAFGPVSVSAHESLDQLAERATYKEITKGEDHPTTIMLFSTALTILAVLAGARASPAKRDVTFLKYV